jgi:hypothetical protein
MSSVMQLNSVPATDENRRARRFRTFKPGLISYDEHKYLVEVTISNRSETGALLVLADGRQNFPQKFSLFCRKDRTITKAEQVWREGESLGVRFTGPEMSIDGNNEPGVRRFRIMVW